MHLVCAEACSELRETWHLGKHTVIRSRNGPPSRMAMPPFLLFIDRSGNAVVCSSARSISFSRSVRPRTIPPPPSSIRTRPVVPDATPLPPPQQRTSPISEQGVRVTSVPVEAAVERRDTDVFPSFLGASRSTGAESIMGRFSKTAFFWFVLFLLAPFDGPKGDGCRCNSRPPVRPYLVSVPATGIAKSGVGGSPHARSSCS